ncbi:MAG: sulfatase [Henriciella sp.]
MVFGSKVSVFALLASVALTACGNAEVLEPEVRTEEPGMIISEGEARRPNFVIIYTDDQRSDFIGYKNTSVETPHMDRLAKGGLTFNQAIVTTALCSPSRATLLTGRYASVNGVLSVDEAAMREEEVCFSETMRASGYRTAYFGKWHLTNPAVPAQCGFEETLYFHGIEGYFDTPLFEDDAPVETSGYLEITLAGAIGDYLGSLGDDDAPFLIHYASLAPHMDKDFAWPNTADTETLYSEERFPLPETWEASLEGKPEYLQTSRSRRRAVEVYGYDDPLKVEAHHRAYAGAVTDLDNAVGVIADALEDAGVLDNTYIIFMGDNGWLMGEYKMTSKLLAYETSIRVPMFISGPGVTPGAVSQALVTNADIAPTILALSGIAPAMPMNGRSLEPLFEDAGAHWRDMAFYEAPASMHEVYPLKAIRSQDWKYIQTLSQGEGRELVFEELYNLKTDPNETLNLVENAAVEDILNELRARMLKEESDVKALIQ